MKEHIASVCSCTFMKHEVIGENTIRITAQQIINSKIEPVFVNWELITEKTEPAIMMVMLTARFEKICFE